MDGICDQLFLSVWVLHNELNLLTLLNTMKEQFGGLGWEERQLE